MYCRNCGEVVDENAVICIKCGTEKGKGMEYCSHCGGKVEKGQMACMTCGYALPKEKISIKEFVKNKKKPIIFSSIVAGIIIIGIIVISVITNVSKAVNFQKLYNEYCIFTWAEVGEDGSYLFIDTNPYDIDGDGLAYPDAYYAVEDINKALGLPSSLYKEIGETSGADGKQVRTYEDLGLEVSWKYHPDKGLEITYSKLKK